MMGFAAILLVFCVVWTISASVLLSRAELSMTAEMLLLAAILAIGVAPFSWVLVHFISTGGAA